MENDKLKNLNHGRETYGVYYGDDFILKRPLPTSGPEKKAEWLKKQHRTQNNINEIRSVHNPVYNIPQMIHIHDDEFQILEERAHGQPLTRELYSTLSRRQKFEIITSIGSFLVDMNELHPIGDVITHKISDDLKYNRLENFIQNKMAKFFTTAETKTMERISKNIGRFEYDTRMAWSHGDLNSGNVLYDPVKSRLSFIDFAEADYKLIYRDIFGPVQMDTEIYKQVYDMYNKMHNKKLYPMPNSKNECLRNIMKYRLMVIDLKRFIKASDDLRITPANEKSAQNNLDKVAFMRKQISNLIGLEQTLSK